MLANRTGARALLAGSVAALMLAACGASATPAPTAAPAATPAATAAPATQAPATDAPATQAPATDAPATQPAATDAPATEPPATAEPTPGGGTDALAALQNLQSYKLAVVIDAKNTTGSLATFGSIKMSGTVILKPAEAADIALEMGAGAGGLKIRIVEIGGKSYIDMGTGNLIASDGSQSSMIDSFKPEKLFGSMAGSLSQMEVVGDETKNGVATTHVKATPAVMAQAGASIGGAFGLAGGTWEMDAWIAKDGGYAVSWVVKGAATVDGKDASLLISMDLSNVNDPANKVVGP